MKPEEMSRWQQRISAARGDIPADLLITGGRIVNVFTGAIEETALAIYDGHVIGFGDYPAQEIKDVHGAYLLPGFLDGHIHIESSKLIPERFAEAVIPHGTAGVIADPHEIANVWGVEGIRFMIENARRCPLNIWFMIPSCVPATGMETAGAVLTADDMAPLLDDPSVLGIGEMMNFPGAMYGDSSVLAKTALSDGHYPVDGHAPGLSGKNLAAYIIAGPSTDHECTTLKEGEEKLSRGMRIMIREGSTARNMEALLPLVTPATERRMLFVSDDRRPGDLVALGHCDNMLRRAVRLGLDPITAIRMVTINTAETFGITGHGALRPGWAADVVVVDNLTDFNVQAVYIKGKPVSGNGESGASADTMSTSNRKRPLKVNVEAVSLHIPDKGVPVRVIGVIPDQIVTDSLTAALPASDGFLEGSLADDILKMAVIERHSGNGGTGFGFVKGLGLKRGAIASTVAHDSHNIIVSGVNDRSMMTAVQRLVEMGGGQVVADGDRVVAELPLPIGGLMSDQSAETVAETEERLIAAAHDLGCPLNDPFMALSFLALPVIPSLKLTDKGLVDVNSFSPVELYLE